MEVRIWRGFGSSRVKEGCRHCSEGVGCRKEERVEEKGWEKEER